MEKERGRSGLNFMEKANNSSHGYYNYYYYHGEDQNHNQTTTSTTHSHHSTTSRVGGMVTSTISSSSSSSSHPHTTTTPLVVPPPSFNHHHYNREVVGGQDRSLAGKLDLMDTSPIHSRKVTTDNSSNTTDEKQVMGGLELRTSDEGAAAAVEREHMFDKVVTPSDVGKLNRLVIPKQHAEKYFPLVSSINDKGLVLNFVDASNGNTCWRFRYSYWNSSQSYVMTKGWSRFVKDKKLDAGDIVSFQRGKGQLNKERLFIDWRPRPAHPPPPPPPLAMAFASDNFSLHPRYFPGNRSNNIYYRSSPMLMGYWSTSSVVSPPPPPPPVLSLPGHAATPLTGRGWGRGDGGGDHYYHPSTNFKTTCYNNYYGGMGNPGSNGIYFRSAPVTTEVSPQQHQASSTTLIMLFPSSSGSDAGVERVNPQLQQEEEEVVLLQSVPIAQGKTAAKRLRLFGVNMDCPISLDEECQEEN